MSSNRIDKAIPKMYRAAEENPFTNHGPDKALPEHKNPFVTEKMKKGIKNGTRK